MRTDLVGASPHPSSAVTSRIVVHLAVEADEVELEPPPSLWSGGKTTIETDAYPQPGDQFQNFTIKEVLGCGGFARVYLAEQDCLARRRVVLKVSTLISDEPQKLARLQHANIVPVYSVHAAGGVETICMPFLGRRTLHTVMQRDDGKPCDLPESLARRGESHVDSALWVIAQLAAGLAHSHGKGILHRDLKPANVLITDDGVPMLLDFNVSSESPKASAGDRIGGTFQYMAPEHLQAYDGAFTDVDQRSDLYSLGVILYELLAGWLPHPPREEDCTGRGLHTRMVEARQAAPPAPSRFNPAVPAAVDAIVLKLLEPRPEHRYRRAGELHDDLVRQLENRPLKHVRERSVRERVRKWRKRNPRLFTGLVVSATALIAFILPAGTIAAERARQRQRMDELQHVEALEQYRKTLDELPAAAVLLGSRSDPAQREQGAAQAMAIFERYGLLANAEWEAAPAFRLLEPSHQRELKAGFGELCILLTRLELLKPDRGEAAKWNRFAAMMFAEPPAVVARHAAELAGTIADEKPRQPLDYYFDGLDLATAGRCREASPLLATACERRPDHFQSWFARGVCHEWLGQPLDAVAAFSACIALRPEFAHAHLNRALAYMKARRPAEAETDLNRALELKPEWLPARINRGLVRDTLRKQKEAEADYTAALEDAACPTRVWFLRARVRRLLGNEGGYAADRAEGMKREPKDALSWRTRGTWRRAAKEYDSAIADFDAALKMNPNDTDALLHKGIVLADDLHQEAKAIPVFDRLLELAPDQVDARCSRGVYHARLGHAKEARRDASDALQADGSAYRLFQVAGLFAQLGRFEPDAKKEAVKHLARAMRAGFDNSALLKSDHDLDPIRSEPEAMRMLASVKVVEDVGK